MWLKEVVVEGFKSYAVRQSIGPFDSQFSAITGLNGTGKSNILDAICFVLGITQLQQVRVSALSELVYKNGQAGVTAASVSLTFDNSDARRAPVGYSEYSELVISRQVVMGGKSTYKINGQLAQQSRVATLFQSVGLNVNNPHFLIMQGRITKVINMKPLELLSLIEEAAGTRLFEAKKQTALRTISRKQAKLDEINALLDTQIQPTLQRLRDDQTTAQLYDAKQQRLSQLRRVHTAFQYHSARQLVQQLQQQWESHAAQVEEREAAVSRLQQSVEQQHSKCEQLECQGAEDETGESTDAQQRPSIAVLESELSEASKRLVQATSSWNNSKEAAQSEREAVDARSAAAQQQLSDERRAQEAARDVAASVASTEAALLSLRQQLDECRAKELGVGIAAHGTQGGSRQEGGGLHGALMAAQKQLSLATTQATHARKQISQAQADIAAKAKEQASHKQQYDAISRQQREVKRKTSGFRQQAKVRSERQATDSSTPHHTTPHHTLSHHSRCHGLALAAAVLTVLPRSSCSSRCAVPCCAQSVSVASPARAELDARLSALADELSTLQRELSAVSARLSRYDFACSAPHASLDGSRVLGSVLSNLTVPRDADCRAVETSAAGRLSNVIVDSEQTGRRLLESGGLKQRVTLIPLNRISQQSAIPAAVAERATSLFGEAARVAVQCVSFERRVEPAMQFVFGSSFVCPDVQTASQLAFTPNIARRAVTLDGDVVDPHGTMEGGASAQQQAGAMSIVQLQKRRLAIQARISEVQAEQAELQTSLAAAEAAATRLSSLQSDLESAEHSLELLRVESEQCGYSACERAVRQWTEQCDKWRLEAEAAEGEQRRLSAECASLEREMEQCETEQGRSAASAALRKRIAALQSEVASTSQQASASQHAQLAARARLAQLRDDSVQAEAELQTARQQLTQLEAAALAEQRRVQASSEVYEAAKACLAAAQQALQQRSRQYQQAVKAKQRLTAQRKECELEVRRLHSAGSKLEAELSDSRRRVERLAKDNAWIAGALQSFGQAGGDFDFAPFSCSAGSSHSPYTRLQEEVAALAKLVNKKAGGAVERAEAEYASLSSKRGIVEADKLKIGQVIDELEVKKQQAVSSTWQRVNADFGHIMGALLPGVSAQLRPVGASDTAAAATQPSTTAAELSRLVAAGVEMRVAFGGVWKESLSELSGGQRSLLSLSFILALLLFKPAPMYILDEIDAALDLSHTQNIGAMIRQHFPHSQFIVVSLKEGLFQHANTLFRTHFVNGVSAVSVQRHNSSGAPAAGKAQIGGAAKDSKGRKRQQANEQNKENRLAANRV